MERQRPIRLGAMVLIAVVMAALGGGLVGGVTGFRLARISDPQPELGVITVTEVPAATQQPRPTAVPLPEGAEPVVDVVQRLAPAVVTILASSDAGEATGSGVVISEDGYIVTNDHVVDGAQELRVIFTDGSIQEAELIGTDQFADLAVIQVEGEVSSVAALGDSDALLPGQTVIAIGSPLGTYKNSVTTGVVSALNRSVTLYPGRTMEGLIQTDAAINHGNSGGPLINLAGEIIGINTLVVRGSEQFTSSDPTDIAQGLGFAVPSNTVSTVAEHLIRDGKVERPYLGISYEMITRELAAAEGLPVDEGARITNIPVNGTCIGPAARAGLLNGDIITAIDGVQLTEQNTLQQVLLQHKPGETVTVDVLRNGVTTEVPLELTPRPTEEELAACR